MNNNSLYGNYRTRTFADIFSPEPGETEKDSYDVFKEYYDNIGIPKMIREEQVGENINSLKTLFYLLYANYGNSSIASQNEDQFIYKLFSIIFMYGSSWEKRLEIQIKLKNLTDEQLVQGSKIIVNHAYNPGTEPSVGSLEELQAINEQNSSNNKRSLLDAYTYLWEAIKTDVTKEFIDRFQNLFLKVVIPQDPLWYISEEEE